MKILDGLIAMADKYGMKVETPSSDAAQEWGAVQDQSDGEA